MKAFLKNYRQAPRKVRLVAKLIKGKDVEKAIVILDFLVKRAGLPIKKLLLGAVANALQIGVEKENLFVKELRVDKGVTMKRMKPRAMGRGFRINKRTSHITLVLEEKIVKNSKEKNKNIEDVEKKILNTKEVIKPEKVLTKKMEESNIKK